MRVDSYKIALFHWTVSYGAAGRYFTVAQIACFGEGDVHATIIFHDPKREPRPVRPSCTGALRACIT